MHTVYGNSISGNCWKPAFMLRQRGLPFRWVEVDILAGASRTPEFLAMNPNGRVPLLQLPDGRRLAESNAMLLHLGEGTAWLPADAYERAKVYEWLFFEQYTHEPAVATVRFWVAYLKKHEEWREKIAETMVKGYAALGVMERQLGRTPYLVGAAPTLADIALYAYTHVAHEGGYRLDDYPALRAWLARFAELPGFVAMPCKGP
ncbi:MAG: glutathione S-transferase family protein [Nevskia sp.]|nr:glutathione S-transferase family protein [Nevskia sp.]